MTREEFETKQIKQWEELWFVDKAFFDDEGFHVDFNLPYEQIQPAVERCLVKMADEEGMILEKEEQP